MPEVILAVTILKPDAIAGESFPVRVALMNRGGFSIAVHSGLGSSPLSFDVLAEDGEVLATFSDELARGRTQPDRAPPPRPKLDTLAPGAGRIYEQDAFRAALEPLAPGSYRLVARYRFGEARWQSDPAPFTLRAPSPSAFAALGSTASRTLAWVLADARPGEKVLLFARESKEGIASGGVAHRFASLEAGKGPSSCAVAEELGAWQGARWNAWIRDGRLTACLSAGAEAFVTTEPVATGLENGELLPTGRQHDAATASFLVAGTSAGKARLKEFTLRRAQAPAAREVGLPAVPDRRSAVCFESGAGAVTTHVVLCVAARDGGAVVIRSFGPGDSGDAGTTRTLLQTPRRIVALSAPVSVSPSSEVTVLLSKDDNKGLEVVTVPLGGGKPGPSRDRPAPPLDRGETAREWAVGTSADGGDAPLVLVTDRRVLTLAPDAPGWSEVEDSGGASRPQVTRLDASPWALWLSDSEGVVYHALAAEEPEEPDETDDDDAAQDAGPEGDGFERMEHPR